MAEFNIGKVVGPQGPPGTDATVTSSNIANALGYTPVSPTQLSDKVKTDVPLNAEFTDTVTTINNKTGVISKEDIVALGIPSTDTNTTYSEITTAEIDTGTASTLRTITGRRVKYILDKIQGWIGGLTKSDVGLSNVDNTSDSAKPISTATQTALDKKTVIITSAAEPSLDVGDQWHKEI